jgi:hypothetical protein
VRSTTKLDSKNSLYPLSHFTEYLVGVFRKLPRKSDLNHEYSSLLIQRLKNQTGFTLQPFTQNRSPRELKSKELGKWNRLADNQAESYWNSRTEEMAQAEGASQACSLYAKNAGKKSH